jgi:nitroimidazol reductase NimA-like FMN-containing flavoprotein (pyridoxamine 5'-phosphate oxidase superfamily)
VTPAVAPGAERARAIIDEGVFMTLATADAQGVPWASPVWYAPDGYSELLWVSDPNARHSRNIALRPQIAIVIFDSRQTPGDGLAVYMEARAEQVDPGRLGAFNARSVAQGLVEWGPEKVQEPARHRLYRAAVSEHWVLRDDIDERVPVSP